MKKLIALLLALIMAVSMAACGSKDDSTATPDTAQTTNTTGSDETDATTGTTGATDSSEPYVPKIGEGVYSKTSFTVSDQELVDHHNDVVATIGEDTLTMSELQTYYWISVYSFLNDYSYYLSMFGMDVSVPLDQQQCPETDGTWQQYFLHEALNGWHVNQALVLTGKAQNMSLKEDIAKELASLKEELKKGAEEGKYASVDEMLQKNFGPGVTQEGYVAYMDDYYGGYSFYLQTYDSLKVTDDEIEKYFTENKDALKEANITKEEGKSIDIRHILLTPEGGTTDSNGNTTYTEDAWNKCKEKAQGILDTWLAGEKTEESFAALANTHSTDPGSNTTGGLYQGVASGDMVEEFDAWCFDSSRKVGDHGLVKTDYGYHIMFFSAEEPRWVAECRNGVKSTKIDEIMANASKEYPMTVDYEKIMLGYVNLSGEES